MKDQYFGDINDYRKYGLLRDLAGISGLKLGVCWMRTNPDHRTDGELRQYLDFPSRWRHYDADLYDLLRRLVNPTIQRDLTHAESWGLLPGALYHRDSLVNDGGSREEYFRNAWLALEQSKLMFFDPDNGMEVKSAPYGTKRAAKYLFWREVEGAFNLRYSLVIYQHFRREARSPFIKKLADEFKKRLAVDVVFSFRTPHVVFFVIPHPEHASLFSGVCEAIEAKWFTQVRGYRH
jgi:hypothetical protein